MTQQARRLGEVDAATLRRWLDEGRADLVDVREPNENAAERIPEASLIPLSSFADRIPSAPPGKRTVVFHCRSGNRTGKAADLLCRSSYDEVYHLVGGIEAWKQAGFRTERST
jgi:rhodanese-related sulfurtransferase